MLDCIGLTGSWILCCSAYGGQPDVQQQASEYNYGTGELANLYYWYLSQCRCVMAASDCTLSPSFSSQNNYIYRYCVFVDGAANTFQDYSQQQPAGFQHQQQAQPQQGELLYLWCYFNSH